MKKLSFLFICLVLPIASQARIITVDDDDPADFNNIQAAIDDSNDGDVIVVSDGTYTGLGNRDIDFKGKAITLRSENGPENCVIDCQASENDRHRGFDFHSNEDQNSVLDGFIVTNGYANDLVTTGLKDGAAIKCDGSSPLIINCILIRNAGNGVYCGNAASPHLINCIISENLCNGVTCSWRGVAPTLINCTITGNGEEGVWCWKSRPTLTNCIIWANAVGPFTLLAAYPTVTYSCFEGDYVWPEDVWPGIGNVNANPCFVKQGYWDADVEGACGDYHLRADSSCIDAGDPNYVPEPNETDLDGNPRVIGGRIDMGAYEFSAQPIEVPMKFTPQAINCRSSGKWVKAHFFLPAEFTVADVDSNKPAKIEPFGIESEYMNVFVNEDGVVEIEAAFDRAGFCNTAGCGPVEVTVVGLLTNGQSFYGTDTIKIIKNSFECLAILSSSWLEMNCNKPDWCNGFDIDRDSIVNLKDFAIMAYHWLEEY
jgi:hypothetical protein